MSTAIVALRPAPPSCLLWCANGFLRLERETRSHRFAFVFLRSWFCFRVVPFFSFVRLCVRWWVMAGFEYSEKTILGVNAASKWAQEMAELNLAIKATPFYLGYKDAGLIGVSCVAQDNHLDDLMWYTLHNIVSLAGRGRSFGLSVSLVSISLVSVAIASVSLSLDVHL